MQVQYIDLKKLEEDESEILIPIVDERIKKIERITPKATLVIHVHKQKKAGSRCKYSLKARLDNPSIILETQADDWDLAITAHKVLAHVEQVLKKKYKTEGHYQK